nr:unnamed protein product [Callosobruchus chinensis]
MHKHDWIIITENWGYRRERRRSARRCTLRQISSRSDQRPGGAGKIIKKTKVGNMKIMRNIKKLKVVLKHYKTIDQRARTSGCR